MSQLLPTYVAAMRRQLRRIQHIAVFETGAALAFAAVLLGTPPAGWASVVLLLVLLGYLRRKVRQVFWARRGIKQLRLEEQFVRHGPTPQEVLTCVRRPHHLWTQSLTLKGLEHLLTHPPARALPSGEQRGHIGRQYERSYSALRPSGVSVDLIWFMLLVLLWLRLMPEVLLLTLSPPLLGAGTLLLLLVAAVLQAILRADLRDGFERFTALLSEWTITRQFEETLHAAQEKHYRHTLLYRAAPPTLSRRPAGPLREVA